MGMRGSSTVSRFSTVRVGARRLIGVFTAYAVAFQMLFGAIAVSQSAAALASPLLTASDAFVICYGAGGHGGDPAQSPAHSSECYLHCIAGMSLQAALPAAAMLVAQRDAARASYIAALTAFDVVKSPTPRLSQGPPHAP
jgi:hypothetical protein